MHPFEDNWRLNVYLPHREVGCLPTPDNFWMCPEETQRLYYNILQTPDYDLERISKPDKSLDQHNAASCFNEDSLSELAQEEVKQHALEQLHSQDFDNWLDEEVEGFSNRDLRFRRDVILKRIIRNCKKFYFKEFQRFVGKTRQTFAKIKQDRERISKYAREFLNLKFGENISEEMELILFWFIDKKWINTVSKISFNPLKNKLFSIIYTFNTQNMLDWLKMEGLCKMMISYLNTKDIVSHILIGETNLKLIEVYERYIQSVKKIWVQNLMNSINNFE